MGGGQEGWDPIHGCFGCDRCEECEGCDQEYFPAGHVKSNFLCNLGYGDRSKLFPRAPRLAFSEACTLL